MNEQRIQAQRAAEAEQKQREREVALLSPIIDTTIQRIKDLQSYKLTFGELVELLDAMDKFYEDRGEGKVMKQWSTEYAMSQDYDHKSQSANGHSKATQRWNS